MLDPLRKAAARDAIANLGYFRCIEWHDAIDSTNRYLGRRLKADAIGLPALVVADEQTAGAGRGANAWWSPQGCLMFSMGLSWPQSSADLARLPLRVGLAVAECLAPFTTERPRVKWPNDVYLNDRKVCGILIESSSRSEPSSQTQDLAIVGIGINCQVDFGSAPSAIRGTAISLHEATGEGSHESTTPESVLVEFLQRWLAIEQRQQEHPHWLDEAWPTWSWLDGKLVQVQQGNQTFIGIARGIDARGGLRVEDPSGHCHTFLSATVRPLDTIV